jgi:hypothetical protein
MSCGLGEKELSQSREVYILWILRCRGEHIKIARRVQASVLTRIHFYVGIYGQTVRTCPSNFRGHGKWEVQFEHSVYA